NADIAYAIRRYLDVRNDDGFIAETGAEMLVETARSWIDPGLYGEDDQFHIHGVTGPDAYTAVVDDNAHTHLNARLNLHFAATTMRRLEAERPEDHRRLVDELRVDPAEIDDWTRAAERMYVPHDPKRDITPQDATFLSHERWDLDATPVEEFPLL